MRESGERPYYGFNAVRYITFALIGIGIIIMVIAIVLTLSAYPIWALILCWGLGAILFIFGVLWHLLMGFASDPKKMELLQRDFLEHLERIWNGKGKVLDIGTGSGRAAIEVARHFPEAQVVGMDLWSKGWRFFGVAKAQAEDNAKIENVSDRCVFQQGNALDMPFEDGEFQLVVSSFVFHEIRIPDRTELFKEAIRVLAPGGIFMIFDVFYSLNRKYKAGNVSELLEKIERLGAEGVEYRSLKEANINLGSMAHLWRVAYIFGRKAGSGQGHLLE
jgi:ubiquinone/menaquinone biosynthesis C-methylase UbiE